jgi:NAD(P)-dependent dehydrogenase (short-subunit alcohol dehydrogenase family)
MDKKTVIITGASGELAQSVIAEFLNNNWRIIACSHRNSLPEIYNNHKDITHIRCDATQEDDIISLCASHTYHAIVHLVGGIKAGTSIIETTIMTLQDMITINTMSTFLILREGIRYFSQINGGSIITVASQSALQAQVNKSAYSAAKAAVISLTKTAAEEGKHHNIRCNCIVPGIIRTPSNLSWAENGEEQNWTNPDDIAKSMVFLSSEAGKGINGAIIPLLGTI